MNAGIDSASAAPLRCLSVQQPFAWLICSGIKTVENRTISTPYRGPIAIHTGTTRTNVNEAVRANPRLRPDLFPFMAIVGVAELVDVVPLNESLEDNPNAFGPMCWVLANARPLREPIPSKGKLNLYSLTPAESARVRQLDPGTRPPELSAAGREWEAALRDSELDVRAGQASTYMDMGRYDDAIRLLDRAISLDGSQPHLYVNRAFAHLDGRSDAHAAIADCYRALTLTPDAALVYMLRSEAHWLLGDRDNSAADVRRAEELEPGISRSEEWRPKVEQDEDGTDE